MTIYHSHRIIVCWFS